MEISIFWFIWFGLVCLFSGSYVGMAIQAMWFAKNDMFRPEKYHKRPW
jgi:hypothetical protein